MIAVSMVPYILAQDAVTALVAQNVQPIPAPEDLDDYPCITYQEVSYTTDYTADGCSGFTTVRVVYNCWGNSYLQAQQIAQVMREALSGYRGTLPDGTPVHLIQVVNGEDYFESESRLYRATLHTLVQFAE